MTLHPIMTEFYRFWNKW